MTTPLISVIVPVYKVEPYLRKSVDSILAQTYTNLEVFLIDDGSPDNCPAICDEYAALDSRVKVIHQANAGVSAARNAGLDAATGEYIGFVDSDDWIEPDMYERLFTAMVSFKADIACIDYCIEYGNSATEVNFNRNSGSSTVLYSRDEAVIGQCINELPVTMWTKLINADLFHDLRFLKGVKIGEDKYLSFQLLSRAETVVYEHYKGYHYLQRPSSAINSSFEHDSESLNKENLYYSLLLEILPGKVEYADAVWITTDTFFAKNCARKNKLSNELYGKIKAHMLPHITGKSLNVIDWKQRVFVLTFVLSRKLFQFLNFAVKAIKAQMN